MSDLDCNHCGSIAFTSRVYRDDTYWFTDGDGEECASCGMPGHVVVDDDAAVTWSDVQESGIYCERPDCEDCDEMRVDLKGETSLLSGSQADR